MARLLREFKMGAIFVLRCATFGIVLAFANILPFLLSRGTYQTDGVEVAGWPFQFYELGGYAGFMHFYPWKLAANIVIAVTLSATGAWAFRDGVLRTLSKWPMLGMRLFHKLRTWGTPYAE